MDERIWKVDYFKTEVANKPGEEVRVLGAVRDAGVNLYGVTSFPKGQRVQIDFIPENTAAFKAAAKRAGLKLSPKKGGFMAQGKDRVGAVADIVERLAKARIKVTAIDATCAGKGRYGAIFWVKPQNVSKAVKVLKASKSPVK